MNPLRLLFYQLKQFLKHPLFWLLLPLILILPLFFGGEDGTDAESDHIAIGYCV